MSVANITCMNIDNITIKGNKQRWQGLHGCSQSLAILSAANATKRPVLLIADDMAHAKRIEYEMRLFNDVDQPTTVMIFPDWETLPYDRFSPHQDLVSERLRILTRLPQTRTGIVIVTIHTLMHHLSPSDHLQHSIAITKGDTIDNTQFAKQLQEQGYYRVDQVMESGEFSIRGSIVDLYPTGSHSPFRLDLFDNEIDSIRPFDSETQRSTDSPLDTIQLLPAYEFPFNKASIEHFREAWLTHFPGNPTQCPLYQSILAGQHAAGIEYYLPLFFNKTACFFDYLGDDWLIVANDETYANGTHFWEQIVSRHDQYGHDTTRPILPPSSLFFTVDALFARIKAHSTIKIQAATSDDTAIDFNTSPTPDVRINYQAKTPLDKLHTLSTDPNQRLLICAETAGRQESLLTLLKQNELSAKTYDHWKTFLADNAPLGILVAPMDHGCTMTHEDHKIIIISEPELLGEQVMQRRRRKTHTAYQADAMIHNLIELQIGAFVVHINHGIGRYRGLEVIQTSGQAAEYLCLEYTDNDKLYVPVASLHMISRYSGSEAEHVTLSHLGSKKWERAKRKAMERIHDTATELLEIYAKRMAKSGTAFKRPLEYDAFAAGFPFETTPDQQRAIDEILTDLTSTKPVDRLICGDVGFGKTEVAMRAAFITAMNHQQVLILVPTTLLATQHAQSLQDRFADWPIHITAISRLRTAKEQQTILADFKAGDIDILIGTHRLLQKDVPLDNVGLLVIDEEHRFGVRQKEFIKSLRTQVNILALTATPIPRTLNMTLVDIRDISIIATPPVRRLAIKTFVHEYDKGLIREAIQRELLRGGQVYFLHNRVQSIEGMAAELAELIPESKIAIGHGQMPERQLEQVMADFYRQRYNILVCTTIIESGIDIPTANTIIINRADMLGLAQLHQIRGRVGRSHRQAYAYLLAPEKKALSRDAIKRLDAISSLEDLGAGFMLATHDMEIRGAGELLGDEQSGHIAAIGFALYIELLEAAVKSLREGKTLTLDEAAAPQDDIEISIAASALIPDTYVADVHTRLILYKRIAAAKDDERLNDLRAEIIDRFGPMPEPARLLLAIAPLKRTAAKLGIHSTQCGEEGATLVFGDNTSIDPTQIIQLVQKQPNRYQFKGANKLLIKETGLNTPDSRLNCIKTTLTMLQKS
jgi:transcription-repair coupling factor (superfamily II helicase)